MTLKVRCQQCGKQSQFSQSDAGMTALCVACGARFTIPTTTTTATQTSAGPGDAAAATAGGPSALAAMALAESVGEYRPPVSSAPVAPPVADASRPPGVNYALLY